MAQSIVSRPYDIRNGYSAANLAEARRIMATRRCTSQAILAQQREFKAHRQGRRAA